MGRALLVIDMQNAFVGENRSSFFKYEDSKLIRNINSLIMEYNSDEVYYVVNLMKDNFINKFAPFKVFEGSPEADIVSNLSIVNDKIFKKYVGNAFSNKKLVDSLINSKVTEVEIVGLDGGGCVSLTAFGALDLGFKVIMNTEGIGTVFRKMAKKYYKKLKEKGVQFKESNSDILEQI